MKLRNIILSLALAASLGTAQADQFTVMPTVNQTTRVKYKHKGFYWFTDIQRKYFAKAEQFYGRELGIQGEIKSYADKDDQLRLALALQPKIPRKCKAFVRACYFPRQLNSWKKPEASLLAKKTLGDLTLKLYSNTDFKRTYLEPTILWKMPTKKDLSLFIQGRGLNTHGMRDLKYLSGVMINF